MAKVNYIIYAGIYDIVRFENRKIYNHNKTIYKLNVNEYIRIVT